MRHVAVVDRVVRLGLVRIFAKERVHAVDRIPHQFRDDVLVAPQDPRVDVSHDVDHECIRNAGE